LDLIFCILSVVFHSLLFVALFSLRLLLFVALFVDSKFVWIVCLTLMMDDADLTKIEETFFQFFFAFFF